MKLRIAAILLLLLTPGLSQSPIDGVQSLYQWYLDNPKTTGERLTTAGAFLDSDLIDLLTAAHQTQILDIDPFVNSKVPARTFSFNALNQEGAHATVTVQAVFDSGAGPEFDVFLEERGGQWLVVDFKFPDRTLKPYLQSLLADARPTTTPSPQVTPATPVGGSLKTNLAGTWLHVSTSDTLSGEQKPLAPVEIRWIFRPDGRGEFSQRVSISGAPWLSPLAWKLEGDSILIDGESRYTVVESSDNAMIWKNLKQGNYYHVRRLSDN